MIINKRILAVLFLGFSSGLPLALTGSTLQAWFTQAGVSVITIGVLTLVGMPYVWKFLWAPIMDRFVPPWGGRRRGWIALMQLSLCLALFLLANMNPATQPGMMGLLALLIAFFSASQDVAIDAYRVDVLLPDERGVGAASTIFAYRMAMLLSGGLALVLADYVGWRVTYELMAGLIALSTLVTYFSPEPTTPASPPKNFIAAIVEPFADIFKRESVVLLLLFIIFYKIGDAFALSLMSNFLLHGLGFSLTQIGLAYKTVALVATIMGAFLGGIWLIKLGLYRALLFFGLAQMFSTLLFVLLAWVGKNYALMVFSLFVENLCSGMGTAAFVAFLMMLCNHRYSATQFACLSALAAIGRVFVGPIAGVLVVNVGWVVFFGWAFVISFPGIILLGLLRARVKQYAEAAV